MKMGVLITRLFLGAGLLTRVMIPGMLDVGG